MVPLRPLRLRSVLLELLKPSETASTMGLPWVYHGFSTPNGQHPGHATRVLPPRNHAAQPMSPSPVMQARAGDFTPTSNVTQARALSNSRSVASLALTLSSRTPVPQPHALRMASEAFKPTQNASPSPTEPSLARTRSQYIFTFKSWITGRLKQQTSTSSAWRSSLPLASHSNHPYFELNAQNSQIILGFRPHSLDPLHSHDPLHSQHPLHSHHPLTLHSISEYGFTSFQFASWILRRQQKARGEGGLPRGPSRHRKAARLAALSGAHTAQGGAHTASGGVAVAVTATAGQVTEDGPSTTGLFEDAPALPVSENAESMRPAQLVFENAQLPRRPSAVAHETQPREPQEQTLRRQSTRGQRHPLWNSPGTSESAQRSLPWYSTRKGPLGVSSSVRSGVQQPARTYHSGKAAPQEEFRGEQVSSGNLRRLQPGTPSLRGSSSLSLQPARTYHSGKAAPQEGFQEEQVSAGNPPALPLQLQRSANGPTGRLACSGQPNPQQQQNLQFQPELQPESHTSQLWPSGRQQWPAGRQLIFGSSNGAKLTGMDLFRDPSLRGIGQDSPDAPSLPSSTLQGEAVVRLDAAPVREQVRGPGYPSRVVGGFSQPGATPQTRRAPLTGIWLRGQHGQWQGQGQEQQQQGQEQQQRHSQLMQEQPQPEQTQQQHQEKQQPPQLVEQRSAEWHAMREHRLTASSFSKALGFFDGRVELWEEKIGLSQKFAGNAATNWGETMEPHALEEYQRVSGNEVTAFGFQVYGQDSGDESRGWLGASPDGLIARDGFGKASGPGILEVKCPFNRGVPLEAEPHSKVPFYYIPQAQGLMEIFDRDWLDFYSWTKGGSVVFRVQRDRALWGVMMSAMQEFWFENVLPAKARLEELGLAQELAALHTRMEGDSNEYELNEDMKRRVADANLLGEAVRAVEPLRPSFIHPLTKSIQQQCHQRNQTGQVLKFSRPCITE